MEAERMMRTTNAQKWSSVMMAVKSARWLLTLCLALTLRLDLAPAQDMPPPPPASTSAKSKKQPWLKRVQARLVDVAGYVHIVYEIPGMGVEPDWDWIKQQETK